MAEDRLADQRQERERQAKVVIATLNNLANAMEGQAPRRAVEIATARVVTTALRHHHDKQMKQGSVARSEAIATAVRVERELGSHWVDLEPEILEEAGFDAEEVVQALCCKLILYDRAPFEEWQVFEKMAICLNGRVIDFSVPQDPGMPEIAWAVDAMRYIDDQTPFSSEVAAYIASAALRDGFVSLPHGLEFARDDLDDRLSDFGRSVAAAVVSGSDDEGARLQHERIAAVDTYVNDRHGRLLSDLRSQV